MSTYQKKNIGHSSLEFDNTPEAVLTIQLFYGELAPGKLSYWANSFFGEWHNLPEFIRNQIVMINLVEANELVPALGIKRTISRTYTLFNVPLEEANKLEGYFDAD